jgi:hypothetical protein
MKSDKIVYLGPKTYLIVMILANMDKMPALVYLLDADEYQWISNDIVGVILLGSSEETMGQCSRTTREGDAISPPKTLRH